MRLLLLLVLFASAPSAAQRLPPVPLRYSASIGADPAPSSPPAIEPNDRAWEGAKVGAGILGLGGLGVAYGWCTQGDNGHPSTFGYCAPRALIGGLFGATLGAVVGGFIGSAVPRTPADSAPNRPRETPALAPPPPDHRWDGMVIGAIVVGAAGAVAGSQLCHLSDQVNQHCSRDAVRLGLLGVVTGGIVGGLIGGTIPRTPEHSSP